MTRLALACSLLSACVLACSGSGPGSAGDGECGGKCDSASDLRDALDGKADPIARWMLDQDIQANGAILADYDDMLRGIATLQGCDDDDSIKTFVVSDNLITGQSPFPRLVSTVCSGDAGKASEFFISASFEKFVGFGERTGEIDTRAIEMFAWDPNTREYRFYATEAVSDSESSGVRVEVAPSRCTGCHLTPTDLADTGMNALPIMNELTRPWSHWNAEPGFPSHGFDIPEDVTESETFRVLVEPFKGSAAELEPIIRAGQDRAHLARLRTRRNSPADVSEVMTLLRPLFCDEQVNYISEEFDSGILLNAALVDQGTRNAFLKVKPDWPFEWLNQPQMRIGEADGAQEVQLLPIRGNANALFENQVLSVNALSPLEVLQVRSLDWQTPVLSRLRCELWKDAAERFETDPPDLGEFERNVNAMPAVLRAVLTIDGDTPIVSTEDDQVVVVTETTKAALTALKTALQDGTIAGADCADDGFCQVDMAGYGQMLETFVEEVQADSGARQTLLDLRDTRLCEVMKPVQPADSRFDVEDFPVRFNNRPALPDFSCN